VTEKNNRRVDCAEATKKTVQAMRNEWWGFFVAGDLSRYAARSLLTGEACPLNNNSIKYFLIRSCSCRKIKVFVEMVFP